MRYSTLFLIFVLLLAHGHVVAQTESPPGEASVSEQERLRGSVTPERAWWDLQHYHLQLEVFPDTKSLRGRNTISFKTLAAGQRMQIDLQKPLKITKILHDGTELDFERDGNVYWVKFKEEIPAGVADQVVVYYEGKPLESADPPWSGGFSWRRDEHGKHFIATSCQGIGASIWWPCKDHGYDEPDQGMQISITVPADLVAVSNGRLQDTVSNETAQTKTYHWLVTSPINNYGVNVNIGNYVHFSDKYRGEYGELDLDYWVLEHQRETAEVHFKEAPRTIEAFEYWFGKYPFYADSYKLVVVPYLGMEHQSSVTYGNGFRNGYRGKDISATGVGLKFDFIIIHESGHEWFGNNVSMKDVADMWIHEGFTNYSENLFVEYHFTKKEAEDYVIGCRRLVTNDRPIIGEYNANREGSGDMYYKAGNMLHTMRHVINDDKKWRNILQGLNKTFWHQTVTTEDIESYISRESAIDFRKFFDQYLRTTDIPLFNYSIHDNTLSYHFENVVEGFSMPVRATINGQQVLLRPTEATQTLSWESDISEFELDRNFYVDLK